MVVCLTGIIVALLVTVAAILIRDADTTTTDKLQEHQQYDEGVEWAQGYVAALQDTTDPAALKTSLYAACVLRATTGVLPSVGDDLAHSWLLGCLSVTQRGTVSLTPPTTVNTSSTGG
jgi:hypothetical protein